MAKKGDRWLRDFDIPYLGMKTGVHHFEYVLDDAYFIKYAEQEFRNARLLCKVQMEKKTSMLLFSFDVNGKVEVDCDISTEPFDMDIRANWNLIVKFGDQRIEEEDGVMTLPHDEHQLNISQFIYETAVLAVPLQKIHPGVAAGTLDNEVVRKLAELKVDSLPDNEDQSSEKETDPRWEKLKDIKNKLN
ncbi:MAG: YceD family protein [Thermaurantimonas sp.]